MISTWVLRASFVVIGLNLPVKPAELHEFLHLFIVSIVAVGIIEDGKIEVGSLHNIKCIAHQWRLNFIV